MGEGDGGGSEQRMGGQVGGGAGQPRTQLGGGSVTSGREGGETRPYRLVRGQGAGRALDDPRRTGSGEHEFGVRICVEGGPRGGRRVVGVSLGQAPGRAARLGGKADPARRERGAVRAAPVVRHDA